MRSLFRLAPLCVLTALWFAHQPLAAAGDQQISQLTAQLRSDDAEDRVRAARALRRRGPEAAAATRALTTALGDPSTLVRIEAARALGAIGPAARESLPELVKRFDDHRDAPFQGPVWFAAARAAGKIGDAALPHVMPLLEQQQWDKFLPVAETLATMGPAGRPAVPHLLDSLRSKREVGTIRKASIYALGRIGSAEGEVVEELTRMLGHRDFHTQYFACRALGQIGPEAASATDQLVDLTTKGFTSVRRHAARALGEFGPVAGEKAIDALVKRIDDPAHAVRVEAIVALGKFGPAARAALPELRRTMRDGRLRVPVEAARSVWQVTGSADEIVPVLAAALARPDHATAAARLLGELGDAAAAAADALRRASESDDAVLRAAALAALENVTRNEEPSEKD